MDASDDLNATSRTLETSSDSDSVLRRSMQTSDSSDSENETERWDVTSMQTPLRPNLVKAERDAASAPRSATKAEARPQPLHTIVVSQKGEGPATTRLVRDLLARDALQGEQHFALSTCL